MDLCIKKPQPGDRLHLLQEFHGLGKEVVHLALVIAVLALALGENHVGDTVRGDVDGLLAIGTLGIPQMQVVGNAVQNLEDQTIHLLAVVGGLAGKAPVEDVATVPVRMPLQGPVLTYHPRAPGLHAGLVDLPGNTPVGDGAFQTGQGGIHLGDGVPALAQLKGGVGDLVLRQARILALIESVGPVQELIDLNSVIAELTLPHTGYGGFVPAGIRLC